MCSSKWSVGVAVLGVAASASSALACLAPDSCSPCAPADVALDVLKLDLAAGEKSEGQSVSVAPALAGLNAGGEAVVTVHVFSNDYSTTVPGPAVDPVINAGDTVHWVFDAGFHSVTSITSSPESFDSGVIFTAGATFDRVFNNPGTYPYICSIHGFDTGGATGGGMAGVITVLAVPEPASAIALLAPLALLRSRRA